VENPTSDLSDEELNEDYTLRTVESLEVDAMLDKFSPIKGPKKSQNSQIVTSTPRKKSKEKKTTDEMNAIFLELSGEAESQPQIYPTHYFNILNIFGIGCSNYKVSTVEERHKKSMTVNTTTISSGKSFINEDSTLGLVSEDEIELEDRSFDRSVLNNQDFPLSSSFSNMYKKNGLHIEEGQVGRYHPLPEAKFELLPPEDLLRKVKRQNSQNFHRRSRSMENFRNQHLSPSKKYSSGSLHPREQSRFLEEDESSLPSPPPVPSVVTSKKIPPSHNGNLSSTTATDEENEPPNGHRRNHSEGSRIGHRRTPSMEGVAQIQNGLKRNGKRHPDLPPKVPSVNHNSSHYSHHKKRYSHRKMRLIDIDDDMERYILYGKETTL